MASIDDESGSSSKKTVGKHGVTRLQKIHKAKSNGKRIEVQWNSRGQPIKHNSKTFASFIGVTIRRLVPIRLDNWSAKKNKEAVGVYKQNIWDEIEKAFIIGEEHRAFVYREAGKLHRAFKTKMARSYLKDSKGGFVKHRPAKYSFCIKQDDWDKFVAQHMTAKFQKVSDENRERALNPQHPYRKSCLGCACLEAYMVEESEVGEINRSQVWKAARVNKSGVIDNENVQRVVDQCEKLTEALSEEERQDLGPTNILFEALNFPNYSGRVRTYGFGVNIEVAIVPNAPFPISVEDGDVSMVGQAIGTIVPWPTKLLEFVAECEKIPGQSQNKESIKEILDHNWLSASIITVFSRYLYDKFISPNGLINKFSFISPHVSREDNLGNGIAKILLKDEEFKDKMILAPCNLGKHWVLLVINLNAEVIYYMDPLNGEPTKHQNFKTKFENALQIYRANSSSKVPKVSKSKKISWQKIKVIMENEFMIPTNYFFDHKCRTYSHDKLTEVKEDWATYVVDDVFDV
ncbi:unnamed protein product [Vicia faba]|uniref:Ubiquitin-like protease family profile domain-containing protein n=1 Tax=Vicia faba TaxID=3906 RepID=A0AAV1ADW9_VICFA|nr:unnamed protein product [Vicia faba]